MSQAATDLNVLEKVLVNITPDTDISSQDAMIQLVGLALLDFWTFGLLDIAGFTTLSAPLELTGQVLPLACMLLLLG